MSDSSTGSGSPIVRFSWGGAIATFFIDDGMHVFGKGSSRKLLKQRVLTTGVGTSLVVATILLWAFYFQTTPYYIVEVLVLAELSGAIGLSFLQIRRTLVKAAGNYPSDPNLQDLLVSEQAHKFLAWSEIRQVRFSKFRNKRILYIYPERERSSRRTYYAINLKGDEIAAQVYTFLREKLGDRVMGSPL